MHPSVEDFIILHSFFIKGHPCKYFSPISIIWQPPPFGWFKVNIDGAALGSPSLAVDGGNFRNHAGDFIGGFSVHLDTTFAFKAELIAAMFTIELSFKYGWHSLWLESDSQFVVGLLITLQWFHGTYLTGGKTACPSSPPCVL